MGLASAHADALDGLEELAFGFDAGGDDNFGFLKFANGFRTDVAHAGGDGAHEILRAVIDGGGAEKDLLERTAKADADAGAAREIGVRSGHAPMETLAG